MTKGDMFIDETITIDFPVSDIMRETINGLNKAFEDNDIITWNMLYEVVGLTAKTDHACGLLTHDQMVSIWERYGTGG